MQIVGPKILILNRPNNLKIKVETDKTNSLISGLMDLFKVNKNILFEFHSSFRNEN